MIALEIITRSCSRTLGDHGTLRNWRKTPKISRICDRRTYNSNYPIITSVHYYTDLRVIQ